MFLCKFAVKLTKKRLQFIIWRLVEPLTRGFFIIWHLAGPFIGVFLNQGFFCFADEYHSQQERCNSLQLEMESICKGVDSL